MRLLFFLLAVGAISACAAPSPESRRLAPASEAMPSFASLEAVKEFLAPEGELLGYIPPPPAPPPPMAAPDPSSTAAPSADSPTSVPSNSNITNRQVADVDEGGIVKTIGEHLVILRRGRLFTVSTAGGRLEASDSIDAFPPGVDASRDWYDEMLVKGDLIVVIGYSYRRGGTEINRFRMAADGSLSFLDAYHLRAQDYYSADNYATRLIGDTLVVMSSNLLGSAADDLHERWPAMRRWKDGSEPFKPIAGPRELFVPAPILAAGGQGVNSIHAVQRCDVTAPEMTCRATAVLGSEARSVYVSSNAAYLWLSEFWNMYHDYGAEDDAFDARPGFVYRIPFDGTPPLALGVRGQPVNQFSFNANPDAGRLDVLVTSGSEGDAMFSPLFASGTAALLRIPMDAFGDGSEELPLEAYQMLGGKDFTYVSANRFVGDHLLYATIGSIRSADGPHRGLLTSVYVPTGQLWRHNMDGVITRLDRLGGDAIAVVSGEDIRFQTLLLDAPAPSLGSAYVEPEAREGERRSHAFYYRADNADGSDGLLGLPLDYPGKPAASGQWEDRAGIFYLRRANRTLDDFGRLETRSVASDDGCIASCTDWYGNARPIFLGDRIFALLGYELVEGRARAAGIQEVQRMSFAPSTGVH